MEAALMLLFLLLPEPSGQPAAARAAGDSLDAARVVELARSSPRVRIAESRRLEARGRLAGARALTPGNPRIEAVASTDERFERRTQWELEVPIGPGPAWFAQMRSARAGMDREGHLAADARRIAIAEALAAYYRLLHARERLTLAQERQALAAQLHASAEDRHRAGEVARLDVLVLETELARARSQLRSEEGAVARERAALATLLGIATTPAVTGRLDDRAIVDEALAGPGARPDLRAAESELRAARADRAAASTRWLPELAYRLDREHEDGEPLTRHGVAVTVPLFDHGQGERLEARARELRAAAELDQRRSLAASEIEGLRLAHAASSGALDELKEQSARLERTETMARESYRAGKIGLPSLLVVRRELLEARREYADRLLEAALAGIELAAATGAWR